MVEDELNSNRWTKDETKDELIDNRWTKDETKDESIAIRPNVVPGQYFLDQT